MTESEKELLSEIAASEFRKNWLAGSVWLVIALAAVGLMIGGGYHLIVG